MAKPSSDQLPARRRIRFLLRQFVLIFLNRARRALGVAAQNLQRDELGELRKETRELGSASVESVSHVGAELREISDRLSKLESDIAALRDLLGERTPAADVKPEKTGETPAQSLTAD